jgi:hypothetical protein
MHTGVELLVLSDAYEPCRGLLALARGQRGANVDIVRVRDATDRRHRLLPAVREVERVEATVLGVVAPLEEA